MVEQRTIKCCRIPNKLDPDETRIYDRIREGHCAQKEAAHECSGRITIDRNGITLSCPLCGDSRGLHNRAPVQPPKSLWSRARDWLAANNPLRVAAE
jgi:hypothetical protein